MAAARWREGHRRALFFAGTLATAACLVAGKGLLLGPFVSRLGLAATLVVVIFIGVAWRWRAVTGLDAGDAVLTALPAFLVLVVALANTPMVYEMTAFAAHLPHPSGGEEGDVVILRPFEARHPNARVSWIYPAGTNATSLTSETAAAFSDAGWALRSSRPPREGLFGFVQAERWGFLASCNVWDAPEARVHCYLTV